MPASSSEKKYLDAETCLEWHVSVLMLRLRYFSSCVLATKAFSSASLRILRPNSRLIPQLELSLVNQQGDFGLLRGGTREVPEARPHWALRSRTRTTKRENKSTRSVAKLKLWDYRYRIHQRFSCKLRGRRGISIAPSSLKQGCAFEDAQNSTKEYTN